MSRPLYVQLYSLRHETAKDPEQTLRQVPSFGYDGVETAGDYGWSAARWNQLLNDLKLKAVAAHAGLDPLEKNDATLEWAKALGMKAVIVPALAESLRNPDGYRDAARRLNAVGQRAAALGLKLGYHHHAFEFDRLANGERGIDILLKETDPHQVAFQIDTYWVEKGGDRADAFVQTHADRVMSLHMKDFQRSSGEDVSCGSGDVPIAAVAGLARQHPAWDIVVEYEGKNAPEAVTASAAFLKKALTN